MQKYVYKPFIRPSEMFNVLFIRLNNVLMFPTTRNAMWTETETSLFLPYCREHVKYANKMSTEISERTRHTR
jgi:hypothetical protein